MKKLHISILILGLTTLCAMQGMGIQDPEEFSSAMQDINEPIDATEIQEEFALAIGSNNSSRAQEMLKRGADVNGLAQTGRPLIVEAAREGRLSSVTFLLKNRADATVTCDDGHNALSSICSRFDQLDHPSVVSQRNTIIQLLLLHPEKNRIITDTESVFKTHDQKKHLNAMADLVMSMQGEEGAKAVCILAKSIYIPRG